ncbi:unnamed protein product, partial [Cladocopium goreaui]
FDDSQGAGIAAFKATSLKPSGPTDFGFLLGQQQEARSTPLPASPLSNSSGVGGYGDSGGVLKRCRSKGDQDMWIETKRLAVEGLQPPAPPLRPQEVLFGAVQGEDRGSNLMDPPLVRTDPFHWLRDDMHENEEIRQLLEDEDLYCCRALASLQELSDELHREMRSHEKESSVGIPSIYPGGYAYYSRGSKKKAYESHFRARIQRDGNPVPSDVAALAQAIDLQLVDEELLLDENELNDDGEGGSRPYLSTCGPDPSADHVLFAYAKDFEGNDSYRISFHDTRQNAELKEDNVELEETDGSILWENSGHAAIYYVGHDHEFRGYIVRKHVVGTPQSSDTVVLEEKDRRFSVSICKSSDERFLIIQSASSETAENYLLDLDTDSKQSKLISVCAREFGIHYDVDHCMGFLYILTDKDGTKNSKLCRTPLASIPSQSMHWEDLWVPEEHIHLDSLQCFEHFLAITGRRNGASCIYVMLLPNGGGKGPIHSLIFPEMLASSGFITTPRTQAAAQTLFSVSLAGNDLFKTDILRVHYTSYIVPGRDYAYHVPTREFKLIKESGPERYNPSLYRAERITSKERQVPISLVYRADLHPQGLKGGPFPTLLTGYGAYGACQDPGFDSNILCLLDRGVIYAVAHVRGGGELGRDWREEGRYLKVKNRFHDFIAAAETLISMGISERSTLAAWGESSGGLLVTASVNMRPDLFKAILLYVPFVDAVNTMSDPSIPLTCGEWEEIGNPNQRETFYYMLEYSPYDNLRMQDYPAALVTASQNDTMVGYWEPLKYVSKLRRVKTDSNPVLLKATEGGYMLFRLPHCYPWADSFQQRRVFPVAAAALRPSGGILHVHWNAAVDAETETAEKVAMEIEQVLKETRGGDWKANVTAAQRVKNFAPRVRHLRIDISCHSGAEKNTKPSLS